MVLRQDEAPPRSRGRRMLALLAEFPRRDGSWRALCGNLVPAAGMVLFGWSFLLSVLAVYAEAFILTLAVGLVLAVHVVEEDHPRPWSQDVKSRLVRGVLATWLAGTALLSLFPMVGGVMLLAALGMPWPALRAELSSEPVFFVSLLAIVLMHGWSVVRRVWDRERLVAGREAVDDFRLALLRTFALPVLGGVPIALFAGVSRIGQIVFLSALALVITVGDVFRAEWSAVFDRE